MNYIKDFLMKSNLKRMAEIQDSLTKHIKTELKDEEDPMYMATMLLKHAMILYKSMLTDEEIKNMLGHVIDTVEQDYAGFDFKPTKKTTMH